MLGHNGVRRTQRVGKIAQPKAQHDLMRQREIEQHNVAPEQDVAHEDFRHVAVHLHAG